MSELPQEIFSPFRSSRANNFRTSINIFQDTFGKHKNCEWIEEKMCISSRLYTSEVEDRLLKWDYYNFVFNKGDWESLCELG